MADLTLAEISTDVISSINTNFSDIEDAINAKAALNGDSSEVFEVANAVQSTQAVNKGQLDSAISAIDADIADIENELSHSTVNTHFCVNSGNTTDGKGDLLAYTSGTLTIKSGGSYSDIVLTNAQGSEINVNSELSLNMSSYSNGDYNIFITSQGTLEAFANTIYRQTIAPSSPSTNDIWFNTSVEPIIAYIYNGTDFSTEYTGVLIGMATVENGAITEVETFRFNENGYVANRSTISKQAMPSGNYIALTLGASGSTYTAPANGYLALKKGAGASSRYIMFTYNSTNVECLDMSPISDYNLRLMIPVRTGETITYSYSATGTFFYFVFVYAQGEV